MTSHPNNTIKCIETTKIQNPEVLAQVIHKNFIYLTNYPELQHNMKTIIETLRADGNFCYLLYYDKNLIGYFVGDYRVLPDNRYGYYISYVYISKNYRNKKLGTKLMNKLIKSVREKGVKFIVLTCDIRDKKVVSFYTKYGFTKDPNLGGQYVKPHIVYSLYL
jgi:ribosomal protein S18 acetylase RimI-like enzyme